MISVATIALKTHVMPNRLAYAGYVSALVLFVGAGPSPWVQLLFLGGSCCLASTSSVLLGLRPRPGIVHVRPFGYSRLSIA